MSDHVDCCRASPNASTYAWYRSPHDQGRWSAARGVAREARDSHYRGFAAVPAVPLRRSHSLLQREGHSAERCLYDSREGDERAGDSEQARIQRDLSLAGAGCGGRAFAVQVFSWRLLGWAAEAGAVAGVAWDRERGQIAAGAARDGQSADGNA